MKYLNNSKEAKRCSECRYRRRPGFAMSEASLLFVCLECLKEAIESAEKSGRYP